MTTQPWSVYERRLTDRETLKVAIELADQYGDNLQDLKPLLLKEGGATVMEVVNFLAPDTVYSFDARGELIAFLVDAAGWNHHPPPPDVVLPPSSKLLTDSATSIRLVVSHVGSATYASAHPRHGFGHGCGSLGAIRARMRLGIGPTYSPVVLSNTDHT
jgi:hypothetical protein